MVATNSYLDESSPVADPLTTPFARPLPSWTPPTPAIHLPHRPPQPTRQTPPHIDRLHPAVASSPGPASSSAPSCPSPPTFCTPGSPPTSIHQAGHRTSHHRSAPPSGPSVSCSPSKRSHESAGQTASYGAWPASRRRRRRRRLSRHLLRPPPPTPPGMALRPAGSCRRPTGTRRPHGGVRLRPPGEQPHQQQRHIRHPHQQIARLTRGRGCGSGFSDAARLPVGQLRINQDPTPNCGTRCCRHSAQMPSVRPRTDRPVG